MDVKKIKFQIDLSDDSFLKEYDNEIWSVIDIYVMRTGNNAHNIPLTLRAVESSIATLEYKPILANYISYIDDFGSHDPGEVPVGVVTKGASLEEINGETWVRCKAIIYKRFFPEIMNVLANREGKTEISMEIDVLEEIDIDGTNCIDLLSVTGITLLGGHITPAIEGANATVMQFAADMCNLPNKISIPEEVIQTIKFSIGANKKDVLKNNENDIENQNFEKEEKLSMEKQEYIKKYADAFVKEYMNPETGNDKDYMSEFMNDFASREEDTKDFADLDGKLFSYMIEYATEFMKEETMAQENQSEYMKNYMKDMIDDEEDNVYMSDIVFELFGCRKEEMAKPGEEGETHTTVVNTKEETKVTHISPDGDVQTHETTEERTTIYKDTYSQEDVDEITKSHDKKYSELEDKFAIIQNELDEKIQELNALVEYKKEQESIQFSSIVEEVIEDISARVPENKREEISENISQLSQKYSIDNCEEFKHFAKSMGYDFIQSNLPTGDKDETLIFAFGNQSKEEDTNIWQKLRNKYNIKK